MRTMETEESKERNYAIGVQIEGKRRENILSSLAEHTYGENDKGGMWVWVSNK